jgi:hypothetical protein
MSHNPMGLHSLLLEELYLFLFFYFLISHKKFITAFFFVKLDPFNTVIQYWYALFIYLFTNCSMVHATEIYGGKWGNEID